MTNYMFTKYGREKYPKWVFQISQFNNILKNLVLWVAEIFFLKKELDNPKINLLNINLPEGTFSCGLLFEGYRDCQNAYYFSLLF